MFIRCCAGLLFCTLSYGQTLSLPLLVRSDDSFIPSDAYLRIRASVYDSSLTAWKTAHLTKDEGKFALFLTELLSGQMDRVLKLVAPPANTNGEEFADPTLLVATYQRVTAGASDVQILYSYPVSQGRIFFWSPLIASRPKQVYAALVHQREASLFVTHPDPADYLIPLQMDSLRQPQFSMKEALQSQQGSAPGRRIVTLSPSIGFEVAVPKMISVDVSKCNISDGTLAPAQLAACWFAEFPAPKTLAVMSTKSRSYAEHWIRSMSHSELQASLKRPESQKSHIEVAAFDLKGVILVFPALSNLSLIMKRSIYVRIDGNRQEIVNYSQRNFVDDLIERTVEIMKSRRN